MMTVSIQVQEAVAEYCRAKWHDPGCGAVRFPHETELYLLMYEHMQRRPADCPVDRGNLRIALPDRREGNYSWGKNPETYNYLSHRSQVVIARRLRTLMWAEFHTWVDEAKHRLGWQYAEAVYEFMRRYRITALSEDALLKNYQRWKAKTHRRHKQD